MLCMVAVMSVLASVALLLFPFMPIIMCIRIGGRRGGFILRIVGNICSQTLWVWKQFANRW